ncbi:MAG: response regulator transcription factor [Desulfobacterales bacterium]|nr:response regulator transcription factor [Desulfobacterales bacterium]
MKELKEKKNPHSNPVAHIHIVGKNKLQNELLLSFLKEKTRLEVTCSQKLEPASPIHKNDSTTSQFLLIDCTEFDLEKLWAKVDSWKNSIPSQGFVALCNVDPKMKIEKCVMNNNIQGLFYKDDPPDVINKGISAILNGDLWYSIKTMTKFLLEPQLSANSSENTYPDDLLTLREREVLALIVSGQSSGQVSEKLCISPHTVRTHIYNIYNKINVKSRLQATLWAAKYL